MSIPTGSHFFSKNVNQNDDMDRLKNLEGRLNQALIEQPEAVHCVAEMIKRVKTGFCDESKPRGVLVFAGPTGVGKTELAKLTAREMGVPLHRFDMSEFSEPHKISRLLGSPPGYINSDRGGELVNKLTRTPACVVLFDEIEKAHFDIYKIFLQLFDEGRLTDSTGQEVNATKAVFILTTNLGSHEIYRQLESGVRDDLDSRIKDLCIRTFSTELYNRFDKVVVFNPLSDNAIEMIADKYLNFLQGSLAQRKLNMTWDRQVVVHLSALARDVTLGARDMHRKINELVLSKLATSRIEGKIYETDVKIHMKIHEGKLELIVLDRGKIALEKQNKQSLNNNEGTPKNDKAIMLKDGVVYLDIANERPLKEFEGMCVFRSTSRGGSYMDDCIKIIHVSDLREIVYEDVDRVLNNEGKRRFIGTRWDDGGWRPITPARNGRSFFENMCTIIQDSLTKQQALTLIHKIFSILEDDCHLSQDPFNSLRDYCIKRKKEHLLKEIEALEKLMGSFKVTILTKTSTPDSTITERAKL